MLINWEEIQHNLSPLKDYADLCGRLRAAFGYPCMCQAYNFSLPALGDYTRRLLGGDLRGRYREYLARLEAVMTALAGVEDVLDLVARTATPELLGGLAEAQRTNAVEIVTLLKYLVYWVVPGEKYLSSLVRDDPASAAAIPALRNSGIRTNLELMQVGLTAAGRQAVAESSGLPQEIVLDLVNRADFSRLPWASKATISNIIGAGYPSLLALAGAEPEQLTVDFFRYGEKIGKNLKLGNEIENSYRIAKILPRLIET